MSVLTPAQIQDAAELGEAARALSAKRIRDVVAKLPAELRPSVLIVGRTVDDAALMVRMLHDTHPQYTAVAAHGQLVGRSFDLVVYLPGWYGNGNQKAAADQWKIAIVHPRFKDKTKKHELFVA